MFVHHGDMFDKFILRDSESLYNDLKILCAHKNRDLSSLSYRAMEKLLQEVNIYHLYNFLKENMT